ncbi:NAD-dependent epimerase/dehydratase family protein [Gramella sp. AN32]|uniref:NAD-dependent epimerase/dehydratase family protein n=1 Tax=Christiangramia antarctica TaxID=2058158 RepID=A0ABW5XA61_9FLAO|nr:NAD-dependent epimerase/dehydratase family protein [Gramella sp. AN32]MCM4156476.1 3-beta hydroxysteroid dehydrogenase [Gramella sp. AN32]
MKVLVTGAAGFIGSHFCEALAEQDHEVIGLDNFSNYYSVALKKKNAETLEKKGISMIAADLLNPEFSVEIPENINYIFHFAAQPGIDRNTSFDAYLNNNFIATQNLLKFAEKLPDLKMFVHISTSSVYGQMATSAETEVTLPVSDYGVTKLAAEQLVLARSRLGILKATSLRLYSVFGPRERPDKLFTRLIDCALNDKEFPLFENSLKHIRSFTYVEDIVNGVLAVMGKEEQCNNEVFNIGSEHEYTTREGVDSVEKITGKKIKMKILEPRPGDQLRTNANIEKARKILGYHPKTSLYKGLEKQVAWFKNC